MLNVKKIMEKWGKIDKIVRILVEKRPQRGEIAEKVVCNLGLDNVMGYRRRGGGPGEKALFMKLSKKTIDKQKAKGYIRSIEISTRLK